jgi:surface antigen
MRNMPKRMIILAMLVAFMTAACETTGPKTAIGGLGGAAAGGLLGAAIGKRPEFIAAGAILGGLLGGAIGDRLDAADRRAASQAAYQALETVPSGATTEWHNPDSGHYGTVMPTRTYQMASGTYCREYQQTVTIGGELHRSYGTACRQPDGQWKIVN